MVAILLLSAFGVLMVYSASYYSAEKSYGDKFFFFKKQLFGFVVGVVGLFAAGFLPYEKFNLSKKWRWLYLAVPALLLALVFVPGIGKSNYGATRWIGVGSFTIQPSEIAKVGYVLFASCYLSANREKSKSFLGMLPLLLGGGALALLILLEPNMSVTMVLAAVTLAYAFLSGGKLKTFLFLLLPVLLLVPVLIAIEPYRLKRLTAFLDPWKSPKGEGYQLIQSLYALGNGNLFGVGLFHSRQKYRFLPFAESDFILSVIGEEFGFVGILFLFSLDLFIIYRGLKISANAKDLFGGLLSLGITMLFAVQTAINALVVSGSIPPTGLPLPFVSSGNTSLIISMTFAGVLYAVSRNEKPKKKHIV